MLQNMYLNLKKEEIKTNCTHSIVVALNLFHAFY